MAACALAGSHCGKCAAFLPRERRTFAASATSRPSLDGSSNGSVKSMQEEHRPYRHLEKGNLGDEPYRVIPGVGKFYLDELDVWYLFDPPKFLAPLERNYNHAAFLWKKIEKVPEHRRSRLLQLIDPNLIQTTWNIAGMRYLSPKLFTADAFNSLPTPEIQEPFILKRFHGKLAGDCWPFTWIGDISMAFFLGKDDAIYGQLSCSGLFGALLSLNSPMYFKVRPAMCIPSTDEDCDMVLEFGDGQKHLQYVLPPSYTKPVDLSWPFRETAFYIRPLGPGVLVGQLWDHRPDPDQAPPRCLANLMLIQGS